MKKRKADFDEDGPVSQTDIAEQAGLRALVEKPKKAKRKSLFDSDIDRLIHRETARAGVRHVKRGLVATGRQEERRTVIQERYARDEFGELGSRKKAAGRTAMENGHQMGPWRKRGDVYGRQDCFCLDCNRVATVAVEEPVPYKLPLVYGAALTEQCNGRVQDKQE